MNADRWTIEKSREAMAERQREREEANAKRRAEIDERIKQAGIRAEQKFGDGANDDLVLAELIALKILTRNQA